MRSRRFAVSSRNSWSTRGGSAGAPAGARSRTSASLASSTRPPAGSAQPVGRPHPAAEHGLEGVPADGLRQVVVHAHGKAAVALGGHGRRGHGDDRSVVVALPAADLRGRLVPVHPGHLAVHQHDVVGVAVQGLQGGDTVADDVGDVAQPLDEGGGHPLVHLVVLDDEDPPAGAGRGGRRRRVRRTAGAVIAGAHGERLEQRGPPGRLGHPAVEPVGPACPTSAPAGSVPACAGGGGMRPAGWPRAARPGSWSRRPRRRPPHRRARPARSPEHPERHHAVGHADRVHVRPRRRPTTASRWA